MSVSWMENLETNQYFFNLGKLRYYSYGFERDERPFDACKNPLSDYFAGRCGLQDLVEIVGGLCEQEWALQAKDEVQPLLNQLFFFKQGQNKEEIESYKFFFALGQMVTFEFFIHGSMVQRPFESSGEVADTYFNQDKSDAYGMGLDEVFDAVREALKIDYTDVSQTLFQMHSRKVMSDFLFST